MIDENNTSIEALYDVDIKCPVCNKKFTVSKTRSKFMKLIKRDSDNCPYYEDINPIFYTAYVCPECGYAALDRHFLDVTVNGKAEIKNSITPKWRKRVYEGKRDIHTAIEIHMLVLLNYTIMHYPYHEIGKLCLKISWLYRYLNDEKEIEFLKKSYTMLERSYTKEPIHEDLNNEANVLFLLGEISRRLGNYKKSVEWFGYALQSEGMKSNNTLEKMTREQWSEAKYEYEKMKKNNE